MQHRQTGQKTKIQLYDISLVANREQESCKKLNDGFSSTKVDHRLCVLESFIFLNINLGMSRVPAFKTYDTS